MIEHKFDWDSRKAERNLKNHKVSFREAVTVFYDERAFDYYDPDHSETEDRYILLGMSRSLRVLVVSFCFRESDTVIRIISSRKADNDECQEYWKKGGIK